MYAINNLQSFWMIEQIKKKILSCRVEQNVPIMILGNKADIPYGRQISSKDGELIAKRLGNKLKFY